MKKYLKLEQIINFENQFTKNTILTASPIRKVLDAPYCVFLPSKMTGLQPLPSAKFQTHPTVPEHHICPKNTQGFILFLPLLE